MKVAITTCGLGKGKIVRIHCFILNLRSDGISHLLSLQAHILSVLHELILDQLEINVKRYNMPVEHISRLIPNLYILSLDRYGIGREGAQLLADSLHTSTTLSELRLS